MARQPIPSRCSSWTRRSTTSRKIDERLARVVECRFFGGMTEEETAESLGITARTVRRDWTKARAILYRALNDPPSHTGQHRSLATAGR